MKQRIDPDRPIGKLTPVKDFLPPPEALIYPKDVKVTIYLSRPSIEFFKDQAKRHGTKYQRMIRQVVDRYAAHYSRRGP